MYRNPLLTAWGLKQENFPEKNLRSYRFDSSWYLEHAVYQRADTTSHAYEFSRRFFVRAQHQDRFELQDRDVRFAQDVITRNEQLVVVTPIYSPQDLT